MYLLAISLLAFALSAFEYFSIAVYEKKNDFDLLIVWGVFCMTVLIFLIKQDVVTRVKKNTNRPTSRIQRGKRYQFFLEKSPKYIGMSFLICLSFGYLFQMAGIHEGDYWVTIIELSLLFLLGMGQILKHLYFSK